MLFSSLPGVLSLPGSAQKRATGTLVAALVLPLPVLLHCGGGEKAAAGPTAPSKGMREITITHEACSESGKVDALNTKGDGKPDVRRMLDGSGREICRISDLNKDGKPDMFSYFDASGQVRRIETGFEDTGAISSIETYEAGKLVKRELATAGQNRIDTWDYFDASGKRVRRERDINGDGLVDQWWTWNGDKLTVQLDRDANGEPDPVENADEADGGAKSAAPVASGASVPPPPVVTLWPDAPQAEERKPKRGAKAPAKQAAAVGGKK